MNRGLSHTGHDLRITPGSRPAPSFSHPEEYTRPADLWQQAHSAEGYLRRPYPRGNRSRQLPYTIHFNTKQRFGRLIGLREPTHTEPKVELVL